MPEKQKDSGNHTSRIGKRFVKELNEILDKRIELKKDKKRKSIRIISDLIVTHDRWDEIKEDAIEHEIEGHTK